MNNKYINSLLVMLFTDLLDINFTYATIGFDEYIHKRQLNTLHSLSTID